MSESVVLERRDHAAIVRLDRPDRMNALDRRMVERLGEIGRELASDEATRAVVLTGSGDRAFCAGADLKERRGMSVDQVREQLALYRSELGWIDRHRCPVVAAINGVCLGGGLEIALMCDLRVAVPNAVLGLPETSLGIVPGAGGTQRLPRIVGMPKAKEMVLLAQRLTAAEALGCSLVNRVTPEGADLLSDTLAFLAPILDGAPIAQTAALEAIDGALELPLANGLALEQRLYERCLVTEDRTEALAAFAEKRRPRFVGR